MVGRESDLPHTSASRAKSKGAKAMMDPGAMTTATMEPMHKRAMAGEHELMAEALSKAEAAVNQRLGAMNELRDQINSERTAYASKDYIRSEVKPMSADIEAVQRAMSNMEGRAWALTIAIPLLVSALVSIAIKIL